MDEMTNLTRLRVDELLGELRDVLQVGIAHGELAE